jgi:hypothetical protein
MFALIENDLNDRAQILLNEISYELKLNKYM